MPNIWLFGALLGGGAFLLPPWVFGTSELPWPAMLGMALGLISLLPFNIFGWMGAGDVKFFAVLGFLMGAKALLPIWIIASLIAGTQAMLIMIFPRELVQCIPGWCDAQSKIANSFFIQRLTIARQGRKGLPYAAWLGIGALIVIFNPALMHW